MTTIKKKFDSNDVIEVVQLEDSNVVNTVNNNDETVTEEKTMMTISEFDSFGVTEDDVTQSKDKVQDSIVDTVNSNNNAEVLQKKKSKVLKPAKADYEKARKIIMENCSNCVKLTPKPVVINLKNTVENKTNGGDSNGQSTEQTHEQSENCVETLVIDIENSQDQIDQINKEVEEKVEWLAEMIATSRRKFNAWKKNKKKKRVPVKRTEDGKYVCEKCSRQFNSSGSYYGHQKTVHRKIRPHKCKLCNKRFKHVGGLRTHSKIHTDVKPFECQQCDSRFRTRYDLKTHTRSHTGERPFACEICGKKLATKTSWTHHVKLHKGDKPFPCKKCDKCFVAKYSLNKHMKYCHNKNKT